MTKLYNSNPTICNRKGDLSKKWYIEFYKKGKRHQLIGGKQFGLSRSDPSSETYEERTHFFEQLATAIKNALDKGWEPNSPPIVSDELLIKEQNARFLINYAIRLKKENATSNYKQYRYRGNVFLRFLESKKLAEKPIEFITKDHFANSYPSSKAITKMDTSRFLKPFSIH